MRVHITLDKALLDDESRRDETLHELTLRGFRPEDRQPLGRRFGIYRGDIESGGLIASLEDVAGVAKVEIDEIKRILDT